MIELLKKFKNNFPYTFYLIIFLIIFFLLNKISKQFLIQSKSEKRFVPEFVEKVYGKENVEDYQKVLNEQNTPLRYEKFVEFIENERIETFTIVNSMGIRCNYNDNSLCFPPEGGQKEIWIFGGSTVFGYGVKNNETISAYLENLLGKKFKVINFGTGFYWSTQERILLNNLLTKYDKPAKLIFLNGINEFAKTYKYDESVNSQLIKYKLSKSSKDDLIDYFYERISRLNISQLIKEKLLIKKTEKKLSINEAEINKMVNSYLKNQKIIKAISEKFEIDLIQVLQPAPIYNNSYKSSNIPNEFKWSEDILNYRKVKAGYDLYLERILDDVIDLSNFEINEPMYIDGVHYSPQFNLKIAEKIIENF